MKKILRVGPIPVLLILLLLAGCHPPHPLPTPKPPRIVHIVGSSDLAPIVHRAQNRAQNQNPSLHFIYIPTNTSIGLRLILRGEGDIALASWLSQAPPKDVLVQPLGPDGIAIIVHPGAGVNTLPEETLRQLFSGCYLRWTDVGGADVPIRLVSREEGSGTRAAFETLLMAGKDVALTAVVMPSAQAVLEYVARHEGAVGYVSARLAWGRENVTILAIDGRLPSQEAIEEKSYPLVRDTFAFFRKSAEDLVDYFVPKGN